jgi:hypothetical protein
MLNQVSVSIIVVDNNYSITLNAIDDSNVSRTIKMPVDVSSDEGLFITNLINRAWDYIPDAEPDELSQAKARKIQAINNEWISLEKTGWDSGQGYYLGITPSDVALLVGVFSLAKEAAALGLELPHLISMANTPISFSTIEEMTMLLLQYGQARSNMASSFAARRKAVADATTIEELGVI